MADHPGRDRYLDYSSGIGVTNTGHAHPRVVAAIEAQAARLLHGQQNIVFHEPGLRLYERLGTLLPGGPWQAFLSNSGAEAVEAAVKLARVATGRPVIIAFAAASTAGRPRRWPSRPPRTSTGAPSSRCPGSVYHTEFPYCYRAAGGATRAGCLLLRLGGQLDLPLPPVIDPNRVAAIIVEPVLGEGGYVVPPPGVPAAPPRDHPRSTGSCSSPTRSRRASGGPARCSRSEHWDVEPDILVIAKGIASGMPLSGIVARSELMAAWQPGTHGGTYGGNIVSCAAAMATLDVIEDEDLVANARARGAQLLGGLRELQADHPAIGDVRGLGLHGGHGVREARGGRRAHPRRGPDEAGHRRAPDRKLIVLSAGSTST